MLGGSVVNAVGGHHANSDAELEAGAEGSAPFWWCNFGEVDGSRLNIYILIVALINGMEKPMQCEN